MLLLLCSDLESGLRDADELIPVAIEPSGEDEMGPEKVVDWQGHSRRRIRVPEDEDRDPMNTLVQRQRGCPVSCKTR